MVKLRKDFELANASYESSEASMRKRHQDALNDLADQLEYMTKSKGRYVLSANALLSNLSPICIRLLKRNKTLEPNFSKIKYSTCAQLLASGVALSKRKDTAWLTGQRKSEDSSLQSSMAYRPLTRAYRKPRCVALTSRFRFNRCYFVE